MKTIHFLLIILLIFCVAFYLSFFETKKNQPPKVPQESELFLLNWEDYLSQEVINEFEKEYKIKVHVDTIESSDEILPLLQSTPSKYDLIIAEDSLIPFLKELNFLGEIDQKSVPNLIYLKEELRTNPYDPFNRFCVPYNQGYTGLIINEKYVQNFDGTRKVLFDKNYQGKISMPNMPEEILINALFYLGYPINLPSKEQAEKALELIKKQKELGALWQDPTEQREVLVKEKAWVAYIYSSEFLPIKDLNPNLKFFPLKEGVLLWTDNWCLLADAPHKKAAHLFLNFILDPKINAKNAQDIGISPVVKVAEQFLPDEFRENLKIISFLDKDTLEKSQYFLTKNRPEMREILSEVAKELGL